MAAIKTLSVVDLRSYVESIGEGAFNGCDKLSEVRGSDNLKKIGEVAFIGCFALKGLSLPNVTTIERGAFMGCVLLTDFSAPKVKTIEEKTFSGCSSLTSFAFDNITAIGEGAFARSGLKSFEAPNVESVGKEAFADCKSMINASLPMCATNGMGDYVFSGCSKLKTVYLRWVEVKKIAYGNVLSGCESLEKITLYRPYATKEMSKKIMEQTSKVPIVVSTKVGTNNSNYKTFLYDYKNINDNIDNLSDEEKNLLNKPRVEVIAVGIKVPTRP